MANKGAHTGCRGTRGRPGFWLLGAAGAALCALALLWPPAHARAAGVTGALMLLLLEPGPASPPGATITVNTTDDPGDPTRCSLRYAIQAANDDSAGHGACAAGSGDDTILLTGVSGTISRGSALPALTGNVTITGPGADSLTLDGNDLHRSGFKIESDITVAVSGLTMARGLNHSDSDDYSGGAIYNQSGALTVEDCVFAGNQATSGPVQLGGAIFNSNGTLTVNRSTFTGNTAAEGGGAIRSSHSGGGTLTVSDSTLSGNASTNSSGGGINLSGGTGHTLVNCTLSGNAASGPSGPPADGGGLYCGPGTSLRARHSTFSGNTATQRGGAIKNEGALELHNCTVHGNESGTDGGGIQTSEGEPAETLWIVNTTVSGNSAAGSGGGIQVFSGTAALRNTILAGNSATLSGPDCDGTLTSGDHNLVQDNSCGMTSAGNDQFGVDPLLGALDDHGGPTETLPLCTAGDSRASGPCSGVAAGDSPALDRIGTGSGQCGGAAPYNRDQRNVARPYSTACDIGAYERTGSDPP